MTVVSVIVVTESIPIITGNGVVVWYLINGSLGVTIVVRGCRSIDKGQIIVVVAKG